MKNIYSQALACRRVSRRNCAVNFWKFDFRRAQICSFVLTVFVGRRLPAAAALSNYFVELMELTLEQALSVLPESFLSRGSQVTRHQSGVSAIGQQPSSLRTYS